MMVKSDIFLECLLAGLDPADFIVGSTPRPLTALTTHVGNMLHGLPQLM